MNLHSVQQSLRLAFLILILHTCLITLIIQWSKSEIKGCADRALKLLRAMPEYGVRTGEYFLPSLHLVNHAHQTFVACLCQCR